MPITTTFSRSSNVHTVISNLTSQFKSGQGKKYTIELNPYKESFYVLLYQKEYSENIYTIAKISIFSQ